MKVNDTITFTREVLASTGYGTYPVLIENLALLDTYNELLKGRPTKRHWTFLAIKEGTAKVQFAKFRPWDLADAVYEDILPIDVEPADAEGAEAKEFAAFKTGGWTPFAKPDTDAQNILREAVTGRPGVDYKPLLVTRQIVNGVNLIFAANANVVHPDAIPYPVLVRVYKTPGGAAKIVNVAPLGSPLNIGSYGAFRNVDDDDKAVLSAAFKNFNGAGYTADAVSTQLVAGRNYRFAGTQTLITRDAPKYPVLFTVYQPLFGGPVFTGAEKVFDLV